MTLYGYARVSVREPEDKNLDLQVERLVRAGCSLGNIRAEEASGARNDRGGLLELLDLVVEGGTLVVTQQMVESRSMVNGASPGPAPACHARAGNSRLTRSSWRTWPHRKLRRKVPRVDGALPMPPSVQAVPPEHAGGGDAAATSQRRRNQGHHLVAGVRPARGAAKVEALPDEFGQAEMPGQDGRKEQPGIGHQAVVVDR